MAIKKYHVSKNLFDYVNVTIQNGAYVDDNGDIITSGATATVAKILWSWTPVDGQTDYCMGSESDRPWTRVYFYDNDKNFISRSDANNDNVNTYKSFTTPANCAYINFQEWNGSNPLEHLDTVMINEGSTPLPYEPYGDSFKDWFYREYGTDTDTITSLPKTIIGDGQPISSYTIKGNMVQSGTPTPSNPVYPTECGDKTANLCYATLTGYNLWTTGAMTPDNSFNMNLAEVEEGKTYTATGISGTYGLYTQPPTAQSITYNQQRETISGTSITIPTGYGIKYIAFRSLANTTEIMLNTGSTALPYEPYGYKIPILSNGNTYPAYLGQVQSTRQIYKKVLTGDDGGTWIKNSIIINGNGYYNQYIFTGYSSNKTGICSHFATVTVTTATEGVYWGGNINFITNSADEIDTVDKWRDYLRNQYNNGTPVTVWYVLATPTTTTLNEPIRKIGTYADTVSNPVTIPTSGTAESFDVSTTLKPSEVSLTYHGWHEHSDTKFTT